MIFCRMYGLAKEFQRRLFMFGHIFAINVYWLYGMSCITIKLSTYLGKLNRPWQLIKMVINMSQVLINYDR